MQTQQSKNNCKITNWQTHPHKKQTSQTALVKIVPQILRETIVSLKWLHWLHWCLERDLLQTCVSHIACLSFKAIPFISSTFCFAFMCSVTFWNLICSQQKWSSTVLLVFYQKEIMLKNIYLIIFLNKIITFDAEYFIPWMHYRASQSQTVPTW